MREANYFVYPYVILVTINIIMAASSAAYWSISAVTAAQLLRLIIQHAPSRVFEENWWLFGILYGLIALFFVIVLNLQAMVALLWVILTKWVVIGQRKVGRYDWDKSSYCQRWQLHLVLSRPLYKGYGNGGVLTPLTGTIFIVWFFRALGATMGKNVCLYPGGKTGLMTEPDLVDVRLVLFSFL
jgi:ABC-type multidrug transport system fused ATPase/permease subunit